MSRMELIQEDAQTGTVTFELLILGSLEEERMRKLLFPLSKETLEFRILPCA